MNNISQRNLEDLDAKRVSEAVTLIQRKSYSEAARILLSVVANTPKVYQHTTLVDDAFYMRFWDQNEFVNFVRKDPPSRKVYWLLSAYPRAYYYLGFISVCEGNFQEAIGYLDSGALLEPTNPQFKTEKGHALMKSGLFAEALAAVEGITNPSPYVSDELFAVALRSKGAALIEMGDLDAAEKSFAQSLEYAPNNKVALNEIQYIRQLAASGKRSSGSSSSHVTHAEGSIVCGSCGSKNVSGSFGFIGKPNSFICENCKFGRTENIATKRFWQFWR